MRFKDWGWALNFPHTCPGEFCAICAYERGKYWGRRRRLSMEIEAKVCDDSGAATTALPTPSQHSQQER